MKAIPFNHLFWVCPELENLNLQQLEFLGVGYLGCGGGKWSPGGGKYLLSWFQHKQRSFVVKAVSTLKQTSRKPAQEPEPVLCND